MWYDALFSGSAAWFGIPAVLGTAFFMLRTVLGFLGVFSDVGDSVGHHDVPHDIPHDVPHELPHDVPMGETPLAHHADVPHHPAGHGQASHAAPLVTAAEIFSVQSLAAFAGAFGWAGLIGREHLGPLGGALIGLVAGVSVAAGVIAIFRQFRKFESDGTITLADMLGLEATVYVRIPARGSGSGQIRVEVRGTERYVSAISRDAMILTGTRVLILAANPDNSVVVQSLAEPAEVTQAPLHQPPSAPQRPALEQGES